MKIYLRHQLFRRKFIDIYYQSTREDIYNTIQLSVKGNQSIEDSFRQYIAAEYLRGENQYDTETSNGKQDAKKFIRFKELPAVLQVSLNRYEYDFNIDRMVKNNSSFKFSDVLDLETILNKDNN